MGARPSVQAGSVSRVSQESIQSLFVSPSGNDANPGTRSRPFSTLARAQQVVRQRDRSMRADIAVYLESGTYRLSAPLQFGPQDSGSNGHQIIWSAAPGANAVISGARHIRGWTLSNKSRNIWDAPVPSTLRTRQIYVDGMRASPAGGKLPVYIKKTRTGYLATSAVMAGWRNPSGIDFVYSGQEGLMAEPVCPVASMKGRIITMAEPCWSNSVRRGTVTRDLVGYGSPNQPTFAENVFELLDQPGEFYLDSRLHRLYYIPRAGENMRTADVESPVLETLITGHGSAKTPVHDIVFANLQFSYATWLQPGTPNGFSEVQANYTVTGKKGYAKQGLCRTVVPAGTCPYGAWTKEPGNVQFSYDRNLSFLNDRFAHLGAAGLNLDNGSQNDTVAASVFTDISGNGIEIGNVNLPTATRSSQTIGITVVDCHLFGLPVEFHGGVGILVGYAARTTISHNQIDHTPYVAISLGWGGWLDKMSRPAVPNFSHDNVVADNLIYDAMLTLADGGDIYTQGVTGSSMRNGEKVTGNVIHDQLDWGYALHSDDGATYVSYIGNVLYNNSYDFGSDHVDNRARKPGFYGPYPDNPRSIQRNFWQQGFPNSSQPRLKLTADGNRIISGPQDVSASILSNAGIEPEFTFPLLSRGGTEPVGSGDNKPGDPAPVAISKHDILSWDPPGESEPGQPSNVLVLYAFAGKAYVTWHPEIAEGSSPVVSYSASACLGTFQAVCKGSAHRTVTISASDFNRVGYAVVPGLDAGKGYTFQVVANSANGSGMPSFRSGWIKPASVAHGLPTRPTRVSVLPGPNLVRVLWYPPSNRSSHPVLSYIVTSSSGQRWAISSLRELILTNSGGRIVRVFKGLIPGRKYRFSIAAVTARGPGPAVWSPKAVPLK